MMNNYGAVSLNRYRFLYFRTNLFNWICHLAYRYKKGQNR